MSSKWDLFVDDDELLERFGRIRSERDLNMTPEQRYDKWKLMCREDEEEAIEAKEKLEEQRELRAEYEYEMKRDEELTK